MTICFKSTLYRVRHETYSRKNIDLRVVSVADVGFTISLGLQQNRTKYLGSVEDEIIKQSDWLEKYQEKELKGQEYYFVI